MIKTFYGIDQLVTAPSARTFLAAMIVGLLFGFDMIGKTVAPRTYNRWRRRLDPEKPFSRLLLDKLSREQADSIVRAVQRTVIVKAVEQELGIPVKLVGVGETIDDMIEDALASMAAAVSRPSITGMVRSRMTHTISSAWSRITVIAEPVSIGFSENARFAATNISLIANPTVSGKPCPPNSPTTLTKSSKRPPAPWSKGNSGWG